MSSFVPVYEPPFYLHKITNYQKAIYERKGHWTEKQKIKYGVFLQIFRDKFQDRQNPVLNKMFRVMSDFIKTRNHNQCRSHHQKMERERFQIDSILDSIRSKYHPREYEIFFEKYSRHIQTIDLQTVLNEKGFTPHKNVENRRRNKIITAQNKILNNQLIQMEKTQGLNVRKIQSIDPVSEVLKQFFDNAQLQNKQIYIPKQSKSDQQLPQIRKQEDPQKDLIEVQNLKGISPLQQKDQQFLKKTGLQYDRDSEQVDDKPKIAFVDIPMSLQMPEVKLGQVKKMFAGMGMKVPDFFNHLGNTTGFGIPNFESYQRYDSQFQSSYQMGAGFGYEENFSVSVKDLEDKRKWHLSEASRLYAEFSEHLQRANNCEQMKQMMIKQMMEMRQGYFYPNGFTNSQF